jgi:hypothetical protein
VDFRNDGRLEITAYIFLGDGGGEVRRGDRGRVGGREEAEWVPMRTPGDQFSSTPTSS